MSGFDLRCVRAIHTDGVFTLGLAEFEDGSGASLVFEVADVFDEQDSAAGMATFSLSIHDADGNYSTVYGGIESSEIVAGALRLGLSPSAADEHGLPQRLVFPLFLGPPEVVELRAGLARPGVTRSS